MLIDIKAAVARAGLDYSEVAEQIFPDNVHPRLALNRVAKGEAFLYEPQIRKLAELTGLTVSELFGESKWKSVRKGETICFMSGDYKAELNTQDWTTKVFHKNSLFHEEILHARFIPLSAYLQQIEKLITNQLNK
jgi:hypothetical protein